MKKIIIFLSLFISLVCFSSAIIINLGSGEKLESSNWNSLSSVLNKVETNSDDLKINGKFNISGKIIDSNTGKVLGECDADKHWDDATISCINNTRNYDIENGIGIQNWVDGSWADYTVVSCNSGYENNSNICTPKGCSSTTNSGYSVSALTHNQTKTFTKEVNITGGKNIYSQAFTCNLGTLSKNGGQSITNTICYSGYQRSGNTCQKQITYLPSGAYCCRRPWDGGIASCGGRVRNWGKVYPSCISGYGDTLGCRSGADDLGGGYHRCR